MVTLLVTESKLGHRDKNFEQELQKVLFGSDWVRLELFLPDFKQVINRTGPFPFIGGWPASAPQALPLGRQLNFHEI